ncbi:hypothetical protein [Bifidobacterium eulemuris]|uniref:Uncharacterized protein n=1 Tax=Bifidobacterium eulemuris TaxID=1765219 RepID=A0A261GB79_9BIFI|nr:hypothetical protein [Bifidobacterium eulemuris]OZG68236.1 hypothetical protein BEUL_1249 [Bifidobacterium eulemuris]QOL31708.1 hypothetical protein BE0216_03945 [Bifidobacterium eulemuris]
MRHRYRRISRCPDCGRKPKAMLRTVSVDTMDIPPRVENAWCWRIECRCGFKKWMLVTLLLANYGFAEMMARSEAMRDKAIRYWNIWVTDGTGGALRRWKEWA